MGNSLKIEEEFFSFLRKHFSKEDLIKLDYAVIPNGVTNKLTRFYSNNTSIWFSRLKVNVGRKIYYFGSIEDEKLGEKTKVHPRVIFYFDEKNTRSTIRFYKGDFLVLIDTPKSGEVYNKLKNNSLKIMHGSKDISSNRFYVDLGELNSNKLIKNLDFFIKTFNFKIDLKSVILSDLSVIKEEIPEDDEFSKPTNLDSDYLKHFKFNLKAIEIRNNIKKSNLSFGDERKLIDYIFKENIDGDYYFDKIFKDRFNKTDEELLIGLNNCIINLKEESDYNVLFKKIIDAIKEDSEILSSINVDDTRFDEQKSISEKDALDDVIGENDSILDSLVTTDDIVDDEKGVDVHDEWIDDSEESVIDDSGIVNPEQEGEDEVYDESEFTMDLNSDLISKILLKLDLNASPFALKGNVHGEYSKTKLIFDLDEFTSNVMFKFNTKTLIDEEREGIVKKIEVDISEDRIYGEIKSVVNYYVDQYKIAKNKFFALKYLKFYIKSDSFNKLILEYGYDENIVNNIINRVKEDIDKNNLEYSDIETKFEIYFRSFESNKKYYDELESHRKNIKVYEIRYNLTHEELTLMFDGIECKIDENNGSMDIEFLIEKDIENLVLDIKSDTCQYVNDLSVHKLMEDLKLSEEGCEKVKRKTRSLIYEDNLRIFEINMEYLFNLRNEMVNSGIINQNEIR